MPTCEELKQPGTPTRVVITLLNVTRPLVQVLISRNGGFMAIQVSVQLFI